MFSADGSSRKRAVIIEDRGLSVDSPWLSLISRWFVDVVVVPVHPNMRTKTWPRLNSWIFCGTLPNHPGHRRRWRYNSGYLGKSQSSFSIVSGLSISYTLFLKMGKSSRLSLRCCERGRARGIVSEGWPLPPAVWELVRSQEVPVGAERAHQILQSCRRGFLRLSKVGTKITCESWVQG